MLRFMGENHEHKLPRTGCADSGEIPGIRGLVRGLAYELDRVDPAAVLEHFEVEVRTRRAARFTHQGNDLPFLDLVANGHEIF